MIEERAGGQLARLIMNQKQTDGFHDPSRKHLIIATAVSAVLEISDF